MTRDHRPAGAPRKQRTRPWHGLALATLLGAVLGGCAGGMMEAKPVCVKPASANVQLAPMYQCEEGMSRRRTINR